MKIERNGKTYELTKKELKGAYDEYDTLQRRSFAQKWVKAYCGSDKDLNLKRSALTDSDYDEIATKYKEQYNEVCDEIDNYSGDIYDEIVAETLDSIELPEDNNQNKK